MGRSQWLSSPPLSRIGRSGLPRNHCGSYCLGSIWDQFGINVDHLEIIVRLQKFKTIFSNCDMGSAPSARSLGVLELFVRCTFLDLWKLLERWTFETPDYLLL